MNKACLENFFCFRFLNVFFFERGQYGDPGKSKTIAAEH